MNIEQIYRNYWLLTEELHPELQDELNNIGDRPKSYRFNSLTKKIRGMIKEGKDTGLTDDKPKKGSSRAVLFHKEDHPITIDGVQKALDMCVNTGTHPADFHKQNLGIWKHPVTGKEHIVSSDAGFSVSVLGAYQKARANMWKAKGGY